jgi:hypothetical protein
VGKEVSLIVSKKREEDPKVKAYVARYTKLKVMDVVGCASVPEGVNIRVRDNTAGAAAKAERDAAAAGKTTASSAGKAHVKPGESLSRSAVKEAETGENLTDKALKEGEKPAWYGAEPQAGPAGEYEWIQQY